MGKSHSQRKAGIDTEGPSLGVVFKERAANGLHSALEYVCYACSCFGGSLEDVRLVLRCDCCDLLRTDKRHLCQVGIRGAVPRSRVLQA
eukprot:scaffold124669_cov35-Tisochrysis_lutea.AAC.2